MGGVLTSFLSSMLVIMLKAIPKFCSGPSLHVRHEYYRNLKEEIKGGMYVFCNIASGNEFHKEAVMQRLFPQYSVIMKLLQSNDNHLRTAAAWVIVKNICFPTSQRFLDGRKASCKACT
ncbi:hypothetical protein L6164_029936 [Bauhinia variegata]|uniref:Uncharacterized protein n=1 Tax=Bauhinia variegata TaxID=167791 RepID=A0ACB9LAU4_BAUVA|nr:hypothetical protein L6164_029936 [Bauhinia variegata]